MSLHQKRPQTKAITLTSAVLFCALVGFNLYWKKSPTLLATHDLQAKVEVTKKKISDNQLLLDRLVKRAPSADGMSGEFMDQYVLMNERFSSIVTGIVESSQAKGFRVNKLALEGQTTEGGYRKMLYLLEAEASFVEVGKFLEKLEDAPLLIEVNSIEINRIDNEMKRCKTRIKLFSYVRSE